jgi:hypothetical protein
LSQVRLGFPALFSLLLARVLEDQRNGQYDPKRSLCVISVFQAAAFNDVTAYCNVWPIKCRQESKTNKSNCQFWKKSTCDWLVDNSKSGFIWRETTVHHEAHVFRGLSCPILRPHRLPNVAAVGQVRMLANRGDSAPLAPRRMLS